MTLRQEKGDGANLCEAPSGPFRQISPVPFFFLRSCVSIYIIIARFHEMGNLLATPARQEELAFWPNSCESGYQGKRQIEP
jgi:hypothetical protein